MVKLTYYDWGDAMIQEMREEYKEKMSRENHTYRICWKLYDELADLFCNEGPISEDFKTFLVQLEKQREEQYNRHYNWGCAMECGTVLDNQPEGELLTGQRMAAEARKSVEWVMKSYSEEMFMLWKLFCRVETYCRTQEAAYMCVLGMEETDKKNGIHPL